MSNERDVGRKDGIDGARSYSTTQRCPLGGGAGPDD